MSSNVKFDKETLIKHRFWIALGLFVPMLLVAWLVLILSVSGAIAKKKDDYKKSVEAVTKVSDPKTKHYVDPMTAKKGQLAERKNIVWSEVWSNVSDIPAEWPYNERTPELKALANAKFGTPLPPERDVEVRQAYRDDIYPGYKEGKRAEFMDLAGPITLDFDRVIDLPNIVQNGPLPSMEEIWLTQETIWAKRELLRIIRQTINNLAWFTPVDSEAGKDKLPEGVVNRRVFRNSDWQLDLQLKRGGDSKRTLVISGASKLKNINAAKRTLPLHGVFIKVVQTSPTDANKTIEGPGFQVQGDPLAWNQEHPIGQDIPVESWNFNEKSPLWAWQVFNWSTSPIKQIDVLALGYQSSRTAFQDVKPLKEDEAAAPAAAAQPATPSPSGQQGAGMMGGGASPGGSGGANPMGGSSLGAMASPDRTKSTSGFGIERRRYLQVTPQVRRIPVGIVLVMDQAYIKDLMAHFVNARLRFMPTQVQWQQDTRGIKPPDSGGSKDGDKEPDIAKGRMGGPIGVTAAGGPMGGGGMQTGMMQMQQQMMQNMRGTRGMQPNQMMPMGASGAGAEGAGGAQSRAPGTGEESDPNLVELALYGVISLYDHYQPAATAEQQPGAAPAASGAAPAVGQPTKPDAAPKPRDQPKPETAPKAGDQPKTEPAPKTEDQKPDAAPKADEKKTEPPAADDTKKAGEKKDQ